MPFLYLDAGGKSGWEDTERGVGVDFAAAFEFGDGGVVVACVVDAEFAVVNLGDFNFFGFVGLGYPIVGQSITAIDEVVTTLFVDVGADVFPNEFVIGCDFDKAAIGAFGDEGVAVGQTLYGTDEDTVKFVVFYEGRQPCFVGCVLPDDFEGLRIEFDDA